ncbi:MAG: SDR family NAD(P)-dependent oxidoreductase, partial [Paracoccaceae bacterium]
MSAPIVFIVGAGDYIGAAIARRFAKGGFTVCLGRRNGDKLEPLLEDLRNTGQKAYGYSFDARDEEATEEIFKKIES